MRYDIYAYHVPEGGDSLFEEAFEQAYQHLPLLQGLPYGEALRVAKANTDSTDFDELVMRDSQGSLVGYAAVAVDWDCHVGKCLGVIWCWVHPDCQGSTRFVQTLHREVRSAAQKRGIPYAYTRTVGYSVITKYKGVNYGQEGKKDFL